MSADLYLQLQWLPSPGAGWRTELRAAAQAENVGKALRALSNYALSANQLTQLGRKITDLVAAGAQLEGFTPFRLGLVSNATLDLLVPLLVASAARQGILLECIKGNFGQAMQDALDGNSRINQARCDAVLVGLDHRELVSPSQGQVGQDPVEGALMRLQAIRDGLAAHGGAPAILQTIAPPPENLYGNYERRAFESIRARAARYNERLLKSLEGSSDHLLDVDAIAQVVGASQWHSPGEWHIGKIPFSLKVSPYFSDQVARLLGAISGKSRRALVLDLDNTLWGGVIGDDGPEGVHLGQGDALGEAYLDVQRFALDLRARGVVLAVSSKNDDATARDMFRKHPDMLIREKHIAVFQANWSDKARNIEAISRTLDLGLSAFVFLDDNPAERALVRQMLPDVAVPELPDDPALYARTLAAAGYFETHLMSHEDAERSGYYEANAQRAALADASGGLDAYLASLDMEIGFAPFSSGGLERVTQLIAKSNQFNLTTRRYAAHEVAQMAKDRDLHTIQVRLRDIFGDNGMISVIILRPLEPDVWRIDSWLMSCRVLGRGVEAMVLAEICRAAQARGIAIVEGVYKPTPRNGLVRDHYARLGFSLLRTEADGTTYWRRSTHAPVACAHIRRMDASPVSQEDPAPA